MSTEAALSSAGRIMAQLYLYNGRVSDERCASWKNLPVIPTHGKRECRIHEALSHFNMATGDGKIRNHFTKRDLPRLVSVCCRHSEASENSP